MNPQADALNKTLKGTALALLSKKGKAAFWPRLGILQQTLDARGKELDATIGTAVGDDGTPMRLPAVASHLDVEPKAAYPYAPGMGVMALREAWKTELKAKNPSLNSEISLPIVTAGLTHGLSLIGSLFVDPGTEIVLPDLFWGNYKRIFEHIHGGKLVPFETFKGSEFNTEGLKEALGRGEGKKILLLNFPNNPSGYTPTEQEAEAILAVIKENAEAGDKIFVILDDAYFGLQYADGMQESLFAKLANLHKSVLAVKVDGATKEEFMWGFRIGFLTYGAWGLDSDAYQALVEKTAGTIRATVSNCNHPGQSLLLQALKDPDHQREKLQKLNTLKARYEKVKEVLEKHEEYQEYFEALPFNSGYFMCLKLKEGIDPEKVRQTLLKDYDTGVIALPSGLLRIAYSGIPVAKIPTLFENISSACKD